MCGGAVAKEGLNNVRFSRHSREGGIPVSLAFKGLKTLDPSLLGDDDTCFRAFPARFRATAWPQVQGNRP